MKLPYLIKRDSDEKGNAKHIQIGISENPELFQVWEGRTGQGGILFSGWQLGMCGSGRRDFRPIGWPE